MQNPECLLLGKTYEELDDLTVPQQFSCLMFQNEKYLVCINKTLSLMSAKSTGLTLFPNEYKTYWLDTVA